MGITPDYSLGLLFHIRRMWKSALTGSLLLLIGRIHPCRHRRCSEMEERISCHVSGVVGEVEEEIMISMIFGILSSKKEQIQTRKAKPCQ